MIRQACPADALVITQLLAELGYDQGLQQVTEALTAQNHRDDRLFVYEGEQPDEHGATVLGLIALLPFDYFPNLSRTCRITALVVSEQGRGQGIGTALMAFAEDFARQNGCTVLEVTTNQRRQETQAFYQAQGMTGTSVKFVKSLIC